MSKKINNAFYELIKNIWKILKLYNKGEKRESISALRKVYSQIEELINAIDGEEKSNK